MIDIPVLARAVAVVLLGLAVLMVVIHGGGERPEFITSIDPATIETTPLQTELARCKDLGMAAADDARCKAAWAESRARFLRTDPSSPVAPVKP